MIESSLKMIANGLLSIVIDCSDPEISRKLGEPKALKKLDLPNNLSLLEIIICRLKDLGTVATGKYGKGFEWEREAILPVICVNELDVEKVEEELLKNDYFGYKGILCFGCVSSTSVQRSGLFFQ